MNHPLTLLHPNFGNFHAQLPLGTEEDLEDLFQTLAFSTCSFRARAFAEIVRIAKQYSTILIRVKERPYVLFKVPARIFLRGQPLHGLGVNNICLPNSGQMLVAQSNVFGSIIDLEDLQQVSRKLSRWQPS
ncbi:hypothetical protein N9L31_00095 [bacterium]|nr:hypothetical protein [bacterium]